MIRLLETRGEARPLLPPGRDLAAWHAALTGEIARHLSPAHAALLARPERTAAGVAWLADGAARSSYGALPAASRRALDVALGAILSDIRRLAESGEAPAVREAWPALREVPDPAHVFAVDGRPVLAAWGHAGTGAPGRLSRLDDGVPWRATPRPHWGRYGLALGILAALGLAAGLLLPLAPGLLVDRPAACAIVPGQLEALRGQQEEESRGAQLRTLLASLTEEVGRRQLQCPIPGAPPPPARTPMPPTPPRADLPQERWDRRDLSMLEGCWDLTTNLFLINPDGQRGARLSALRLCFDRAGRGRQTATIEDNRSCAGALSVAFGEGGTLDVKDEEPCRGTGLNVGRTNRVCRRTSDTEADCAGRGIDNPAVTFTGHFRRSAVQ